VAAIAVTSLSAPQAAPVQPVPDRLHVTPRFEASFFTVAVKVRAWAVGTLKEVGDIETEMGTAPPVMLPPPHAVITTDNEKSVLTAAILCIDGLPTFVGIEEQTFGAAKLYGVSEVMQHSFLPDSTASSSIIHWREEGSFLAKWDVLATLEYGRGCINKRCRSLRS